MGTTIPEITTPVINPDDYTIVHENGLIKCYNTSNIKDKNNLSKYTPLWTAPDNEEFIDYRKPVPQKLNIEHQVKHYHDLNTTELYTAYERIIRIIERMEKQSKDPRMARNMSDYHTKWTMMDLRTYCQIWLDDVRFRQDGAGNRWWVWDRIKYFFRGQMKHRVWWLQTFGTICYDMCSRLDAIDGGNDNQQATQIIPHQSHIGFN